MIQVNAYRGKGGGGAGRGGGGRGGGRGGWGGRGARGGVGRRQPWWFISWWITWSPR